MGSLSNSGAGGSGGDGNRHCSGLNTSSFASGIFAGGCGTSFSGFGSCIGIGCNTGTMSGLHTMSLSKNNENNIKNNGYSKSNAATQSVVSLKAQHQNYNGFITSDNTITTTTIIEASATPSSGMTSTDMNTTIATTTNSPTVNAVNITNKSAISDMSNAYCTCSCSSIETVPNLVFHFRVKFFVNDPLLLRNPTTRHLYYLQLRKNYLSINHKISEEKYFQLASLAILVDYGHYNSKLHSNKYFDPNNYFPSWVILYFKLNTLLSNFKY
jgi:hypothetical protein